MENDFFVWEPWLRHLCARSLRSLSFLRCCRWNATMPPMMLWRSVLLLEVFCANRASFFVAENVFKTIQVAEEYDSNPESSEDEVEDEEGEGSEDMSEEEKPKRKRKASKERKPRKEKEKKEGGKRKVSLLDLRFICGRFLLKASNKWKPYGWSAALPCLLKICCVLRLKRVMNQPVVPQGLELLLFQFYSVSWYHFPRSRGLCHIGVARVPCLPKKFLASIVILCLERQYSKQNSVIGLISNIFPPQKILVCLRHCYVTPLSEQHAR